MKAVVKDVMSTHPISVPETTPVKQLAGMLRESGVSGFPCSIMTRSRAPPG